MLARRDGHRLRRECLRARRGDVRRNLGCAVVLGVRAKPRAHGRFGARWVGRVRPSRFRAGHRAASRGGRAHARGSGCPPRRGGTRSHRPRGPRHHGPLAFGGQHSNCGGRAPDRARSRRREGSGVARARDRERSARGNPRDDRRAQDGRFLRRDHADRGHGAPCGFGGLPSRSRGCRNARRVGLRPGSDAGVHRYRAVRHCPRGHDQHRPPRPREKRVDRPRKRRREGDAYRAR